MTFAFLKPLSVNLKRALIETTWWFALYVGVGYALSPNDAMAIEANPLYLIGFLSVMTLFYGIHAALYLMALVATAFFVLYRPFPLRLYLELLVLVFLWGMFYFYWVYHLRLAQSEKEVFKAKLDELGHAFYALKTSHDQLELNYILRPVSLRRTLMEILACFRSRKEEGCFDDLVVLLSKTFNITKMALAVEQEGRFLLKSATDNLPGFDANDTMVQKAIDARRPTYISQKSEHSRYIAVIPAVTEEKVIGIIAIEDMPFMAFNTDNMTFIAFVFQYFMDSLRKTSLTEGFAYFEGFDDAFRFETARTLSMYRTYHIVSSLVVFKTRSELQAYKLERIVEETRRGLDVYAAAKVGGTYVVSVLAPFNVVSSVDVLRERVLENIGERGRKEIESMSFPIASVALAWQYVKE